MNSRERIDPHDVANVVRLFGGNGQIQYTCPECRTGPAFRKRVTMTKTR